MKRQTPKPAPDAEPVPVQGRRALIALWSAIGVLSVTAIGLAVHAAGEEARTAESVCHSALLAITPSTTFVEPFRVRNLNAIDTVAEPEVADVVDSYADSPEPPVGPRSTYIVQGDVVFGHADPTALTCLIVLEGGKARTAPFFATPIG